MGDNREQAEFWNGQMGDAWIQVEANIDRMLEPLTGPALDSLSPKSKEKIIDIGCGCGTTSIMIADRGATVWGIDISGKMIRQANRKKSPVTFTVADAATQPFDAIHDAVFSRFGIMFFSDPRGALQNIRTAMKSDGRLVFLCWQAPANNPWMAMVGQALQPYQPEDMPPPDPDAPGPFSMANPEKTLALLDAAGFTDITIDAVERDILLGETVDDAMAFQQHVGPLSALLAETDPAQHDELITVVRDVFEPLVGPNGIQLPAAAWLVSAKPDQS